MQYYYIIITTTITVFIIGSYFYLPYKVFFTFILSRPSTRGVISFFTLLKLLLKSETIVILFYLHLCHIRSYLSREA